MNKYEFQRVQKLKADGLNSGDIAKELKMSLKKANKLFMENPVNHEEIGREWNLKPQTRVWRSNHVNERRTGITVTDKGVIYHYEKNN